MFKYNHYVPILKSKKGELDALSQISRITKNKLTPFIDVHRVPLKYPERVPTKSLARHLRDIVEKLKEPCEGNNPIFIDMYEIDTSSLIKNIHPIEYLHSLLVENSIYAIPAVGFDRDNDYVAAISNITNNNNSEICIRLLGDDLVSVRELNHNLNDLLRRTDCSCSDAHLLIDLRSLEGDASKGLIKRIASIINDIESLAEWKTLTVAASSYPQSLVKVKANTIVNVARSDFDLWNRLIDGTHGVEREPSFGDYGIVHPVQPEIDPRHMNASAKIRYTLGNSWLVVKGKGVRKKKDDDPGFKQFHNLSRKLVDRSEFMGGSFSRGDAYVVNCANERASCGNLTTWVKNDTTHHLTFVAKQISSFPAS